MWRVGGRRSLAAVAAFTFRRPRGACPSRGERRLPSAFPARAWERKTLHPFQDREEVKRGTEPGRGQPGLRVAFFFLFFLFFFGGVCVGRIAWVQMGGRLGSLRNEGAHGLDLLPVGSGCWAERGVIMGQANRAEPTPRSTFQSRSDWPRAWLGVAAAGLCRAQRVSPCTISGFV